MGQPIGRHYCARPRTHIIGAEQANPTKRMVNDRGLSFRALVPEAQVPFEARRAMDTAATRIASAREWDPQVVSVSARDPYATRTRTSRFQRSRFCSPGFEIQERETEVSMSITLIPAECQPAKFDIDGDVSLCVQVDVLGLARYVVQH